MISVNRDITRQTACRDYRTCQPLVIQLVEGGRLIRLKPKGSRHWYTLTVQQAYDQAVRNEAAALAAEKAKVRAAARLK